MPKFTNLNKILRLIPLEEENFRLLLIKNERILDPVD